MVGGLRSSYLAKGFLFGLVLQFVPLIGLGGSSSDKPFSAAISACRSAMEGRRLVTDRISLRIGRPDDFDRVFEIETDPRVIENMNVRVSPEVAADFTTDNYTRLLNGRVEQALPFVAVDRRTQEILGILTVSIYQPEPEAHEDELSEATEPSTLELGYTIAADHWGQGLATEAGRILIEFLFEATEAEAIMGRVSLANPRSHAVLKKLGFEDTGERVPFIKVEGTIEPLDPDRSDLAVYRLERST